MSNRQIALITSFLLTVLDCGFSVEITLENCNNYFNIDTKVDLSVRGTIYSYPPYYYKDRLKGIWNTDDSIETISEDTFTKVVPVEKIRLFGCYHLINLPDRLLQSAGFRSLKLIIFIHNGIETLPGNIFRGLTELQTLSLDSNQLKNLPPNLLSSNSALIYIGLGNNWLTSLPPELFANNPALEKIDLEENKLTTLDPRLFASNTALTVISLEFNRLASLPSVLFVNNIALHNIDLSNNKLTSLDSQLFAKNTKLGVINLNSNGLTLLHPELFQENAFLGNIYLSDNSISFLSPQLFARWTWVNTILLSYNKIKSLANFYNLQVSVIYLNNNELEELPDGIFGSNVRNIDLSHNKLTFIQAAVFQNSDPRNIDSLDVSNNYLLCLPSLPKNMHRLKLDWNCFDRYRSPICRLHDCRFQKPSKCSNDMKMKINFRTCAKYND